MLKWPAILLCMTLQAVVMAQTIQSTALPESLSFRLYPDNLPGRRGHQLDITQISTNAGTVTARITMYGLGQDKCRIKGHPAEGTFDGTKLVLKAKMDAGDNITCPMAFEIVRGNDGKFEGRYTNSQFAGQMRPD